MRRAIPCLAFCLLTLLWPAASLAQGPVVQPIYKVVATCGSQSYTAGTLNYPTVDLLGNQCNNGTGGAIVGNQSNASSGVATSSTNLGAIGYNYVWNGTTWDQEKGQSGYAGISNQPYTPTDSSTTVTTGGTFQTVFASNTSRINCFIENPTTATEALYVHWTSASATTSNSASLGAGASFVCGANNAVVTGTVSVTATTTGHAFIATGG